MFSRPREQFGDVEISHVVLKMPNLASSSRKFRNFYFAVASLRILALGQTFQGNGANKMWRIVGRPNFVAETSQTKAWESFILTRLRVLYNRESQLVKALPIMPKPLRPMNSTVGLRSILNSPRGHVQ